MATWVTGDVHGPIDIGKLSSKNWPEGRTLTEDDRLLVCGDFGLVWVDPPSSEDKYWLKWLESKPWGETVFVDGNHENHDLLDAMPVTSWHGGRVHRLPGHPHVIHLMRGETYEVEGGTWWCFGGARSHDRKWRTPGVSWWPHEIPSEEEMAHGLETLAAADYAPDFVITHECSYDVLDKALSRDYGRTWGEEPPHDAVTDYLQRVDGLLDWSRVRRWYSGHHHDDRPLDPDGRHVMLYKQVVRLGELPETASSR